MHQESGGFFLSDEIYKSNPGKFYQEYFLATDMVVNNLAFCRSGKY